LKQLKIRISLIVIAAIVLLPLAGPLFNLARPVTATGTGTSTVLGKWFNVDVTGFSLGNVTVPAHGNNIVLTEFGMPSLIASVEVRKDFIKDRQFIKTEWMQMPNGTGRCVMLYEFSLEFYVRIQTNIYDDYIDAHETTIEKPFFKHVFGNVLNGKTTVVTDDQISFKTLALESDFHKKINRVVSGDLNLRMVVNPWFEFADLNESDGYYRYDHQWIAVTELYSQEYENSTFGDHSVNTIQVGESHESHSKLGISASYFGFTPTVLHGTGPMFAAFEQPLTLQSGTENLSYSVFFPDLMQREVTTTSTRVPYGLLPRFTIFGGFHRYEKVRVGTIFDWNPFHPTTFGREIALTPDRSTQQQEVVTGVTVANSFIRQRFEATVWVASEYEFTPMTPNTPQLNKPETYYDDIITDATPSGPADSGGDWQQMSPWWLDLFLVVIIVAVIAAVVVVVGYLIYRATRKGAGKASKVLGKIPLTQTQMAAAVLGAVGEDDDGGEKARGRPADVRKMEKDILRKFLKNFEGR